MIFERGIKMYVSEAIFCDQICSLTENVIRQKFFYINSFTFFFIINVLKKNVSMCQLFVTAFVLSFYKNKFLLKQKYVSETVICIIIC